MPIVATDMRPTIMTPDQMSQLKFQITAYGLLAQNQALPPYLLQATNSKYIVAP